MVDNNVWASQVHHDLSPDPKAVIYCYGHRYIIKVVGLREEEHVVVETLWCPGHNFDGRAVLVSLNELRL